MKDELSVSEVAKLLFCSKQHVHRLHDRGLLPGLPMANHEERKRARPRRFQTAAVRQFMIDHKVPMPIWMRNDDIDA